MVRCPVCKEEGFEKGMLFDKEWVCSSCVHKIAVAHCNLVQECGEWEKDFEFGKV
jgi:hypothetical protein